MTPRILLVEDERIIAYDLRETLESFGHQVVGVAATGEQAIGDAERLAPDLVLMDIHLEGPMDGIDAAGVIRERCGTPVVFLTAYAEDDTLDRAERCSPYGYLVKPVEGRELRATVRMALARRQTELQVERNEQRLRLAADAASLAVWEWDARDQRFYGIGPIDAILGSSPEIPPDGLEAFLERLHPQDRQRLRDALESGNPVSTALRLAGGSSPPRWIELHARSYLGPSGAPSRVIGVVRDITQRRANEEKLRQASVVFSSTAEGLAILDRTCRIESANPAFTQITGYSASEVRGLDPDDFLQARRHQDSLLARLHASDTGHWSGEAACRRKDGRIFPAWLHLCTVPGDGDGVGNFVIALSDITELRMAQARLQHLATHDALTGLGNRHGLDAALELEMQQAHGRGEQLAVMFLDLDGFKIINDSLGHTAGDLLIRTTAGRIAGSLRQSDNAIRLGGDEFIIIAPGIRKAEDCAALAEKVLDGIRPSVDLGTEQVSITGSIGIAIYPEHGDTPGELIKAADSAMYEAKARGRNRHVFFSRRMTARATERLQLEQGLARALSEERLEVHYQPVVSLTDGALVGFEALLRWNDPERGSIEPARFIPVAEECGLIEEIGAYVLRTACRHGRDWIDRGCHDIRIAVNVSVRQLVRDDFLDLVASTLAATGFPAARLELELTESTLFRIEHSRELMGRLKALGVSIAVDDFGTGYSSLSLLKHLPIDRIKIDRSFVKDLPGTGNDQGVVKAIVTMAHSLGILLTAEGVETREQHHLLAELGCECAQGFLFGYPMSRRHADGLICGAAISR